MKFPKISIVTPVFNQVEYLEEAILSVIEQKYPNLEYIIMDGGSTDGTLEIIKKYKEKLYYWKSEADNGIYDALNKGFNKATGEIMGWLNSDDLLVGKCLFSIAEIFDNNREIRWITGTQSIINRLGYFVEIIPSRKWSKFNLLLNDWQTIQQESTYWTRSLWVESGASLNENYHYAADLDLWSRFFNFSQLHSCNIPIGSFRLRPGEQLSSKHYKSYFDEVSKIISGMSCTKKEILVLNRIRFIKKFKWLLKSDSFRNRYEKMFNYPDIISYDKLNEKFI